MELADFLSWFVPVGSGLLAYYIEEHVTWFTKFSELQRRLWAYAMAGGFAMLGWLFSVAMRYAPAPGDDWRLWVAALFAVATESFALGQLVHGVTQLGRTKTAKLVE
jgi:hypothetical protein